MSSRFDPNLRPRNKDDLEATDSSRGSSRVDSSRHRPAGAGATVRASGGFLRTGNAFGGGINSTSNVGRGGRFERLPRHESFLGTASVAEKVIRVSREEKDARFIFQGLEQCCASEEALGSLRVFRNAMARREGWKSLVVEPEVLRSVRGGEGRGTGNELAARNREEGIPLRRARLVKTGMGTGTGTIAGEERRSSFMEWFKGRKTG